VIGEFFTIFNGTVANRQRIKKEKLIEATFFKKGVASQVLR
jgi:hypothetical protein